MINDIILWWARQMIELIPTRYRRWTEAWTDALLVVADPNPDTTEPHATGTSPPRITLLQRRRQQEARLGSFRLDDSGLAALRGAVSGRDRRQKVILQLPPATLLDRPVVLPLAAEHEPARVLQYEIDRITPFRADEIFWTFAIEQRDRANARLHVRLFLVPVAPLAPLLRGLEAAGLAAARLEIARTGAASCRIDLDRAVSRHDRWTRRAMVSATALCGALAIAAIVIPFVRQSIVLDRIEARIAAMRPELAAVETLRQQIIAGSSGLDVLAAERGRVGDALAVLAAVTQALPDDTYLNELTLRQGHLTLNGQSAGAARLIAALSSNPLIGNPSFDAPVTHADQSKLDLFSIRADVATHADAASEAARSSVRRQ